jgi:hypothetical protein
MCRLLPTKEDFEMMLLLFNLTPKGNILKPDKISKNGFTNISNLLTIVIIYTLRYRRGIAAGQPDPDL